VQDKQYCLIKNGEKWETRQIKVGGDNAREVLVLEGLEEGDQLVMNPGGYKELMDLPHIELDTKIELPESAQAEAAELKARAEKMAAASATGAFGGPAPGGVSTDAGALNSAAPAAADTPAEGGPGQRGTAVVDAGNGQDSGGGRGGRQGRRGGPDGGPGGVGDFNPESMAERSLERYDTNRNGKIDSEEVNQIDERRREFVQRGDTNGDGEITRDELIQAGQQMMDRFQSGGGVGGAGAGAGASGGGNAQ
jgi:hypothetical protein